MAVRSLRPRPTNPRGREAGAGVIARRSTRSSVLLAAATLVAVLGVPLALSGLGFSGAVEAASASVPAVDTSTVSPAAPVPGEVVAAQGPDGSPVPPGTVVAGGSGPSPVGRPVPVPAQRAADTLIWVWLLAVPVGGAAAWIWWGRRPMRRDERPDEPRLTSSP